MTIDRFALVNRHAIRITQTDPRAPLQVGNGRIAFNTDITGLQTFIPFNTMSHWGWHVAPEPDGLSSADLEWTDVRVGASNVPYEIGARFGMDREQLDQSAVDPRQFRLSEWMFANPQRINLGRIALVLPQINGHAAVENDLMDTEQKLDPWMGILSSRFTFQGTPVSVQTCVHPDRDLIAFRIESDLVHAGRLAIAIQFPAPDNTEYQHLVGDWNHPERHESRVLRKSERCVQIHRRIASDLYAVEIAWTGEATWIQSEQHSFRLAPANGDAIEFTVEFQPGDTFGPAVQFQEARDAAVRSWETFWTTGGAIDLFGSTDPRAIELERRIVLSQYALAVNCAGNLPPQESGLVSNSWHGKFHMEMYWCTRRNGRYGIAGRCSSGRSVTTGGSFHQRVSGQRDKAIGERDGPK